MNETQMSTHTNTRGREVAAKRRAEELDRELDVARNQPQHIANEIRQLEMKRDRTAEAGHEKVEALRGAAEPRFRAVLREHLHKLMQTGSTGDGRTPDRLPSAVIEAFVTARLGGELYAALDEAVDAALEDPGDPTIQLATSADVDAAIERKRGEDREARERIERLEAEYAEAVAEHRTAMAAVDERR